MSSPTENPLFIHNVQYGNCNVMGDNRFRNGPLFCWRSRVQNEPDCITASICSPISYTDARDRFCRYFGGSADPRNPGNSTCVPDQYVGPLAGDDPTVRNIHGGIVLHPDRKTCDGVGGRLRCLGQGLGQSIRSQSPGQLLIHVGMALGALLVIALVVRYTGVGKRLKKIKIFDTKALKPHGSR